MSKQFSIKDWSESDRPREKLLAKGKGGLTDAELLAILIGSGNIEESAVGLCRRLLADVDHDLNALSKLSVAQLKKYKGIGEAKAISIIAALEIGRRTRETRKKDLNKITSSESVFKLMQPVLGDLQHEEFWVLYLNNSNKVLSKIQLSKGGITGTLVDIRLILKKALELNSVAIILVHNHPSGTLKISKADKEITQKIKLASNSLDIQLLDHLVITEQAYASFADQNLL
ncbi:RadC family protein [Pseudofulvibacter geojedonensis]|uniref:DNA repair protein RadC n=1 Tax=Pseudofulvibacter geojedonensis TaxID=1123758 RepID=A0ABW3I4L2_9FLAO